MKKFYTLYTTLALLFVGYLFVSFSSNPPNGLTGAPPTGSTCMLGNGGCHSGGSFGGSVSISGLPASITPSTTFPITVTVSFSSGSPARGGFQMTVQDASNTFVGSYSNPLANSGIEGAFFDHRNAKFFGGNSSVSYTVDWTSPAGPIGETITMYAAGNVANGNGNTTGDEIVTTQKAGVLSNGPPTATITTSTNVSCNGGIDGSATAQASGGAGGPFSFMWSNGATTATVSNLSAGTHTVTVTDSGGGTNTDMVTITEPSALSISISNQMNIDCNNPTGSATATGSGGTPGYTFAWSTGASTATVNLSAGAHSVTVSDANNCTSTAGVTITEDITPPAAEAGPAKQLDCNSALAFLSGVGSATGANISYQWTTIDGNILGGATSLSLVVNATGTYTLTVSNSTNGCNNSDFTTVTSDMTPPVANAGANMFLDCAMMMVNLDGSGSSAGANITYLWTTPDGNIVSGSTTTSPQVGGAGTYTLTVTNSDNGCTATDQAVVTEDVNMPTSNAGVDKTLTCTVTSLQLDGTGSAQGANFTYQWTTANGNIVSGATGLTPTVNTTGMYCIEVRDNSNNCVSMDCVNVSQNTTPPVANAGNNKELTCTSLSVDLDGSASAQGPSISYQWTTSDGNITAGATTTMPTVDAVGTYTLTVTDNDNGCTAISNVSVSLNTTAPDANAGADKALNCNTSSVSLDGSSATAGATFSWTGPNAFSSTMANPSVSEVGTYTLTVTDPNNGCVAMDVVEVTQTPPPTASISAQTDVDCKGASTGSATAAGSSGTPPYTYVWSSGGTMATENNLPAGTFTVTVTDTDGCSATAMVTLTEPPALIANASSTNATATGATDGTATANPMGGTPAYSYNWSNGATTQSITGLGAGMFTVTVTDANGCTAVETVSVSDVNCSLVSLSFSSTDASCNGGNDGSATVSVANGTEPITYLWSTGGMTATETGLPAGTVSVTITDVNNCSVAGNVTISEPPILNLNVTAQTNVDCNGSTTGTATVEASGGTPGYNFAWSSGGLAATESGLPSGTHTVTVTDANGCTTFTEVTITEPDAISAGLSATDESALGANDGTASANPAGGTPGYTFLWDNGQTTSMISNLAPGQYCVTITDANGCTSTACTMVNGFNCGSMTVTVSGENVSCIGDNDGSAIATEIGGTEPLTYLWSSGGTDMKETNLPPGMYSVTVTDASNCAAIGNVTITEPDLLVLNVDFTMDAECGGELPGSATVSASGGTPGYSYIWSTGGVEATEFGLPVGTHDVTVTDANQCSATTSVEILPIPDTDPPIVVVQDIEIFLDESGSASITADMVDGGSFDNCGVDTMILDISTFDCNNLGSNLIILAVQDVAQNCGFDTVFVQVTDTLSPSLSCPPNIVFNGGCNTPIEYGTPSGQDNCGIANVFLSEGLPSGAFFPLGESTVVWAAQDASGNETFCSFTVTIVNDMEVATEITEPSCAGFMNGAATVNVTGGFPPFTFQWDDPGNQTTPTASDLPAGEYNVIVTDSSGCDAIISVTVTEPDPIAITVDAISEETGNNMDGSISISASGGSGAPFAFQWFLNGQLFSTDEDISGLDGGDYLVFVTDTSGCTVSQTITLDIINGTADPEVAAGITLLPNPTSGLFSVDFELKQPSEVHISIFDLSGRLIHRTLPQTVLLEQFKFDLSGNASGMYLVRILVDDAVITKRVVLSR